MYEREACKLAESAGDGDSRASAAVGRRRSWFFRLAACSALTVACGNSPSSSSGGPASGADASATTSGSFSATSVGGANGASSAGFATSAGSEPLTTGQTGTTTTSTSSISNTSGTAGGSSGSGGVAGGGQGGAATGTGGSLASTDGAAGSSTGSGTGGGGSGGSTCTASILTSGDSDRTLEVGGTSRSYILHVPSSYTGSTPVPLVLDFHGLGGSGSQEASSSGYRQVADREGFVVAFPDGIDNAWNIGPCCTNSSDVDDLGFAKAMVESIASDGCIDLGRVYAAGFSMGGGMSHYLACNAADVFAAVAPSAFDLLVPEEEPCAPSRPISVLAFRGTSDTVVSFEGGPGPSGRITFLGAQASFERWAGIDGCVEPTTSDGDCTYYQQCDADVEVGLCVQQGGSHAPGDANLGWAFLSKFSLP